jgi:hypothetical protein
MQIRDSGVRDSINDKFKCLECTSRVAEVSSEAVRQALLSRWELLKHPLQVVPPDVQVEIAPVLIEHPVPRIVDKNYPSSDCLN